MSCRIAWDPEEKVAVLWDSVSGTAFGQVFEGDDGYERAERFLAWLPEDARKYDRRRLANKRSEFIDYEYEITKPDTIPVREQT